MRLLKEVRFGSDDLRFWFCLQGPAQRRRVPDPPLAVAAAAVPDPGARPGPTRPGEELRRQVGGAAGGQGELPGLDPFPGQEVPSR